MGFRDARKKAGLSVTEVKNALGISDATVYQWGMGDFLQNAKRLPEIAKLYGCTVDELLLGDKE